VELGAAALPFSLPATDGRTYSLDDFADAKVLVVAFTCNHCPYAVAYEDRFIRLQNEYAARGVRLVAINPNDDRGYPEDSFEGMVKRAKDRGFNFPYLRDESQAVARAYDAACTPDPFVFDGDRKLRYNGRIDDSWKNEAKVTRRELKDAIDAILGKSSLAGEQIPAMGCSIKWRH